MWQSLESLYEGVTSARNRLGLALRDFLSGNGPVYREIAEPKPTFADNPEAWNRLRHLNQHYHLESLTQRASVTRYLETLTYLDWLDYFREREPEAFQQAFSGDGERVWLDVGSKNWSYVEALMAFAPEAFRIEGIEIDPNRRYVDLRTRRQYAEAYLQALPESVRKRVRYRAGNVLNYRQSAKVISHFLPFVFKEPHLAWGLPLGLFRPEAILGHVLDLLEPHGLLLIVNQGEAEASRQEELLKEAGKTRPITVKSLGQLPVRFIEYQYLRYGWLCIKRGN
ncbi:MAG TPA: hypothetical protein V6C99_10390 [Oculatellaceae cyanobacterium]|jgi:hypothetical protein